MAAGLYKYALHARIAEGCSYVKSVEEGGQQQASLVPYKRSQSKQGLMTEGLSDIGKTPL